MARPGPQSLSRLARDFLNERPKRGRSNQARICVMKRQGLIFHICHGVALAHWLKFCSMQEQLVSCWREGTRSHKANIWIIWGLVYHTGIARLKTSISLALISDCGMVCRRIMARAGPAQYQSIYLTFDWQEHWFITQFLGAPRK